MNRRTERSLKALLLMVAAGIVGLTFFLTGPALGIPIGLLTVGAIGYAWLASAEQYACDDDTLYEMTRHPTFRNLHWRHPVRGAWRSSSTSNAAEVPVLVGELLICHGLVSGDHLQVIAKT